MRTSINPVVAGIVVIVALVIIGSIAWLRTAHDSGQVAPSHRITKASKAGK